MAKSQKYFAIRKKMKKTKYCILLFIWFWKRKTVGNIKHILSRVGLGNLIQRAQGIFGGDGFVLYYDNGSGYIILYKYQHLSMIHKLNYRENKEYLH